jgi:short-subunit dehydrogenase
VTWALVTGASGGIGRELASLLARDGHDLVLVSRNGVALAELATTLRERHGVSAKVLPKDLSEPAAPAGIAARLEADGIAVEVLVNSAGYGAYGPFAELGAGEQLDMLQVDVVALTHLTRLMLPGMVVRRRGRILNVASTAAFVPGPLMAVYYASKAYVLSLSEALANELEGSGVTVTCLCPGPTATGFQERADMVGSRLFRRPPMSPAAVAAAGYDALVRGDPMAVPGLRNRVLAASIRLVPHRAAARIARRAHERVRP